MKTKIAIWLGILFIGLTGCYDYSNFDNITVDPFSPSLVFPVMNSNITFKELAERSGANTIVEQHPGSDMYFLAFRDTIDIGLASVLFTIPDTTFDESYQLPGGLIPAFSPFPPIGVTETFNQTYNSIAGSELKRVDLSGGTLQVNLTNNINHSINGDITITSIKDASDAPIVLSFSLPTSGSTDNKSVDLNGYYLDLLDPPSTYNNFQYSVSATITYGGNPTFEGDNFAIQLSINNPVYSRITGKINYTYIHANQPYTIGIFNSTIIAEQHIAEPKLSLNFINSFGIPSDVTFTRFEVAYNQDKDTLKNEVVRDSTLLIGTPNTLKYITGSEPSASTYLKLDSRNSNIEDVFNRAPNTLSFGATFNIGDATDNHDYFIRSDSKFQVLSEIEIPLYGWVVTNVITDTVPNVDWPDLNLVNDGSTKIRLKFRFTNELPLNMELQVEFLDTNDALVTQLFDTGSEQLVKSAPVNPSNGESSGPTVAYSYITIDKEKYDLISLSENMVIYYKFSTGGTLHQNVTILSTNSVTVEMSLEASGTIKP